jgi:hypothetical protein
MQLFLYDMFCRPTGALMQTPTVTRLRGGAALSPPCHRAPVSYMPDRHQSGLSHCSCLRLAADGQARMQQHLDRPSCRRHCRFKLPCTGGGFPRRWLIGCPRGFKHADALGLLSNDLHIGGPQLCLEVDQLGRYRTAACTSFGGRTLLLQCGGLRDPIKYQTTSQNPYLPSLVRPPRLSTGLQRGLEATADHRALCSHMGPVM